MSIVPANRPSKQDIGPAHASRVSHAAPSRTSSHSPAHQTPSLSGTHPVLLAGESLIQNLKTGLPLLMMDCVGVLISLLFASFCASLFSETRLALTEQAAPIASSALVYLVAFSLLGLYPGVGISPIVELKYMLLGTLASSAILTAASNQFQHFGLPEITYLFALSISGLLVIPLTRCFAREFFSQFRWWAQPALIVGSGPRVQQLRLTLSRRVSSGLRPVGIVGGTRETDVDEPYWLGPLSDLSKIARNARTNWVLIPLTDETPSCMKKILAHCDSIPNLIVVPQFEEFPSLWTRTRDIGGSLGIHVRERLLSPTSQICKRLFDLIAVITGGILLLPFLLPIFIATWIQIQRTSPGSMFYCQERIGKGGRRFRAWKIRTMIHDGDRVLAQYLKAHPDQEEIWIQTQKLKQDPRIIPGIGQFLRSTSLDELPQLWNVLCGEMSLVGPRPFIEHQECLYGDVLRLYQKVRPGITGLWQISGRNHTTFEDRVHFDAYYVRNWSLWMDIFILARTVRTVLRREGAY